MTTSMGVPAPAVLVVGPSWVGDMVMAQSLFITLQDRGLAGAIDVLAPSWSLPLIARMPQVRAGVEMPIQHGELRLAQRRELGRALRSRNYGRAIVLPRSFKAALVPYFARIPVRTGYRGELRYGLLNDIRSLDEGVLRQTVQRFVALGLPRTEPEPPPVPEPRLQVDPGRQRRLLRELGLRPQPSIIGMMPGAEYGPAKCWPIDRYAALAARLTGEGRQVWIFGSDKDRSSGAAIAQACARGAVDLCGRTSLVDVVDLVALAGQVVTNDSGLMHVAGAVGARVVALYGSTTPDFTPPLTRQATVMYRRLACSPCFARECPLGHFECLRGIGVEDVYRALAGTPGGA